MIDVRQYTRDTTNIWFPNQKEPLYDPQSPQLFQEYWDKEIDRMKNGFFIADGQVFVTGWLYWHTVYWKIKMKKTKNGRTFPVIETPILRDIDWEAAQNFENALNQGVFIELVGSRGFGKTVWQSSYAARIYSLVDKSQVVVSGGNAGDIKTVTDMIDQGLTSIHPVLRKKRLKNDWKLEVQAGFKTPDGEVSDHSSLSQIIMRNYQDGNKSMAINGTRPDFHIIDEIGKIKGFLKCVKDSDGSYWANEQPDADGIIKPSCLPMYTGTGGDMEVGADAAEMFFDPLNNNLLSFPDLWEGRPTPIGWFMPVTKARMEYKTPQSLGQYLGIQHPDLENINILVSDEEKCLKEWWEPRYEKARKSGNATSMLSFKAYWPIKPSDSFLVLSKNNFNIEAAKAQQSKIRQSGYYGMPVHLYHDGERTCHMPTEKLPITQFPIKEQSKDAPVVIWEFPVENPPFGLYVAGIDPYRQGKAEYSESLGAVYIFKRMHDIQGEKFQNMLVASYVARPEQVETWNEQAKLLLKYYNAYALCENDEMGFINYMIYQGEAARHLAPQPGWLKEIVANTTVHREYGIHRSAEQIRNYLHACVKKYMDEILLQERDEEGALLKEVTGVSRIPDMMLLEEIIKFNEDDNFDREIAFSLALALAEHMNPQLIISSLENDPRMKALFKKKTSEVKSGIYGGSDTKKSTIKKPRKSRLFL